MRDNIINIESFSFELLIDFDTHSHFIKCVALYSVSFNYSQNHIRCKRNEMKFSHIRNYIRIFPVQFQLMLLYMYIHMYVNEIKIKL